MNNLQHPEEQPVETTPDLEWKRLEVNNSRRMFVIVIVAYAVAALLYRYLIAHDLGRTGAMFIGLPMVLALGLALAPPARTSTGSIMKGITLALLLVAPLLGEGYLCILIASPLFYLVGALIAVIVNGSVKERRGGKLSACALLMLPFCMEGTIPMLTVPREQTVLVERVVPASLTAVSSALAGPLQTSTPLPRLLRIGFPRPIAAWGSGINIGDTRTVHFTGAETAPPGDLTLRIVASEPRHLRFAVVSDHSKLTEWMRWRESEVTWNSVDATHTRVVWTVRFDRDLDPAWYFGPWERVVVAKATEYLIAANATPQAIR